MSRRIKAWNNRGCDQQFMTAVFQLSAHELGQKDVIITPMVGGDLIIVESEDPELLARKVIRDNAEYRFNFEPTGA